MRIDDEKDFHGYTAQAMLACLDLVWSSRRWFGLPRVQIIHGRGSVLGPTLRSWCDAKGIPWSPHPANPGVTLLHPAQRKLPDAQPARKPMARPLLGRSIPAPPPRPEPEPEPADSALFELEIERLDKAPPRSAIRRKHERG